MPDYHQQAHEEKSYRRAIFLFVSLAVAGACSMYPVACFKNYSSKEKAKLDKKVENLDRTMREEAEDIKDHLPRLCLLYTSDAADE